MFLGAGQVSSRVSGRGISKPSIQVYKTGRDAIII